MFSVLNNFQKIVASSKFNRSHKFVRELTTVGQLRLLQQLEKYFDLIFVAVSNKFIKIFKTKFMKISIILYRFI